MFNLWKIFIKNFFLLFVLIFIYSIFYLLDANLVLLLLLIILLILISSFLMSSLNKELDFKILQIKNKFTIKINLVKQNLKILKNNYLNLLKFKIWIISAFFFFELNTLFFKFIYIYLKNEKFILNIFLLYFNLLFKQLVNQKKLLLK